MLGFNCSGFNPVLGLANTLNTAAKNIQGVLVNAASGVCQCARLDPAMRISGAVRVVPATAVLRQRRGHSGGQKLRADAVRIEQGHDPTSGDPGQSNTRVAQVWQTPADAVDYARAVLGDVKIETKNNADRLAMPGHGLGPKIEQDRQTGITALSSLVNGNTTPTPNELAKVSATGTQLNRDVVETIRRLQPQERAVVVGKLSAEQATAANVERAMMLRRLLLAGYQEPQVFASAAGPEIQRMVAVIDRETDQVLYETRVRRELFANTAGTVLEMGGRVDGQYC